MCENDLIFKSNSGEENDNKKNLIDLNKKHAIKVHIVDECMGRGKTSAIINEINKSNNRLKNFLYIIIS